MDEAAKRIGTPKETLSEGLSYAVSPGLWRSLGADVDALADKVAQDYAEKKHLDETYERFKRLGLALRPRLTTALDTGGTYVQVLPIEVALFNGLKELDAASEPATPSIFCFGKPCTRQLIERISRQKDTSIWGRELVGAQVSALADRIRPRDTVLLFPDGEVPVEAQKLCGPGWAGLSQKRSAGRTRASEPGDLVVGARDGGVGSRSAGAGRGLVGAGRRALIRKRRGAVPVDPAGHPRAAQRGRRGAKKLRVAEGSQDSVAWS